MIHPKAQPNNHRNGTNEGGHAVCLLLQDHVYSEHAMFWVPGTVV